MCPRHRRLLVYVERMADFLLISQWLQGIWLQLEDSGEMRTGFNVRALSHLRPLFVKYA
jgi:hypothetical protein